MIYQWIYSLLTMINRFTSGFTIINHDLPVDLHGFIIMFPGVPVDFPSFSQGFPQDFPTFYSEEEPGGTCRQKVTRKRGKWGVTPTNGTHWDFNRYEGWF